MAWKFFTSSGQEKQIIAPPPASTVAPTHLHPNHSGRAAPTGVTANTAYLVPVAGVVVATAISRLGIDIITQSGNLDLGIYYSDDDATFTRLASTGATACPAPGARTISVGAQTITPVTGRRWYFAFAGDTGASSITTMTNPLVSFYKATSYPLPSTLTGMTVNSGGGVNFPLVVGLI